jgi:hypothetical protein
LWRWRGRRASSSAQALRVCCFPVSVGGAVVELDTRRHARASARSPKQSYTEP